MIVILIQLHTLGAIQSLMTKNRSFDIFNVYFFSRILTHQIHFAPIVCQYKDGETNDHIEIWWSFDFQTVPSTISIPCLRSKLGSKNSSNWQKMIFRFWSISKRTKVFFSSRLYRWIQSAMELFFIQYWRQYVVRRKRNRK